VAITVTPPLLYEPFTDGTADGDPGWLEKRGNWSVDDKKRFVSTPTLKNLALARSTTVSTFTTGRISASVVVGNALAPNATIMFGYRKEGTTFAWRYVTLRKNQILVGDQVKVRSMKVTALALNRRYRVTLDLLADGRVNVSLNGVKRHSYKFPAPVTGKIGLAADSAKSIFDDVTVWDASMLTP
jgi:hypothetical protein